MNRKSRRSLQAGVMAAGLAISSTGCAMLTTERVATFVAKEVGKKAIKDIKEDLDEKKAAERQQQSESQSSQTPPAQSASNSDQLEKRPDSQ